MPVLSCWGAGRVACGEGLVEVSLDLGLSVGVVRVEGGVAFLPGGVAVDVGVLREFAGRCDGSVCVVEDGGVRLLEEWNPVEGSYYKLRCVVEGSAPTLQVNGVYMHRVLGLTPWEDSRRKVRVLGVRRGERVLDVCTGLGYTAIHSLRRGAVVMSVERSETVLRFAEYNPWSRGLEKATVIHGDAIDVVGELEDCSFDRILHDPPRFGLAGELYSQEFYRELFRVLKPGGALFHYVGSPGQLIRGKDLAKGVAARLERAGFVASVVRKEKCVLAFKPR
ncbi:MAG: methyltransferase domain-containing protein [Candidatus Freyarchaeota archaeon]|nr:methyltransferase domain-containing protein [Candidatus Jordarchaeia archaeon]